MIDKLKSYVKTAVIEPVVALTIFRKSEALLVSKAINKLKTSSSVHMIAFEGDE